MTTAAPVFAPAAPGFARRAAARALAAASDALARLALTVSPPPAPRPRGEPVLEFHAAAGATDGALYVDGERVALLPGVTRL